MQIVIDIDENLYTRLFDNGDESVSDMSEACTAIRKGMPLDEIRSKIEELDDEDYGCERYYKAIDDVLKIIDGVMDDELEDEETYEKIKEIIDKEKDKLKRDTEAVPKFVKSYFFKKLMESFDEQDRASKEDAEQFLRDIKAKEQGDADSN